MLESFNLGINGGKDGAGFHIAISLPAEET
jgi:hypothetical protein